MRENFAKALAIELKFEGGKDDDPIDPGGRTNQGVTQRVYAAWRKKKGLAARDVFLMENGERDEIYRDNYFAKVRFDELPPGVDVVVVDGAINSGPSQSIKWLQRALGLNADGVLGDVTMQRTLDHEDHDRLIAAILAAREAFLRALKTFYHFGAGWLSRTAQLRKVGQAWAMGSIGPAVIFVANGNKKATLLDATPLVSTAPADATAAGGSVTTALTGAQQAIAPLQGTSSVLDQVIIALLVAGGLAMAFGFVYAWWARRKNDALSNALMIGSASIVGANDNIDVPAEVKAQYADPEARGGSETGNIAPGVVSTSGRTTGDTEVRVNVPEPIPAEKAA